MAAVMVACRPMRTATHATAVSAVAVSWLAAIAAQGSALMLSVIGQGLGALAGGCGWIGASIPIHRQVWALVNQPVLNFSSLPAAGGYWLGSMVVPFLAAVFMLTLRPRKPTLVGQLAVVQTVWWVALVAGAWLPLLDPVDGHLSRWLLLHRLGPALAWSAPAAAAAVAMFACLRLLELARSYRSELGRRARVAAVVVHLVLPVGGWLCVVFWAGGTPPLRSFIGLAMPVAAVLAFAWFRYPPPFPRPLNAPSRRAVVVLVACVGLTVSVVWAAGRPLPDGGASGVVWGKAESFNNIRPWIGLSEPATISDSVN